MKKYQAVPVIDAKLSLGESPFFDKRTNTLSFVDITRGELWVIDASKIDKKLPLTSEDDYLLKKICIGEQLGTAMPMKKQGEYLLCATKGLYKTNGDKIEMIYDTSAVYADGQRSNDAKCDHAGRLFFGSSVYKSGMKDSGNLFCYDKGDVRILQKDTLISNGLAWSSNKKKFYFSDSPYNAIFEYDYDADTGNISNRRELAHVENQIPDGMCIDADDNLWVAVWGGRRIEKISTKTGETLEIVEVDATNVTSCCFFGEKMNKLFITSSGDGNVGEHEGSVFVCEVDACGTETIYFE